MSLDSLSMTLTPLYYLATKTVRRHVCAKRDASRIWILNCDEISQVTTTLNAARIGDVIPRRPESKSILLLTFDTISHYERMEVKLK
jgi:hypothetical protein